MQGLQHEQQGLQTWLPSHGFYHKTQSIGKGMWFSDSHPAQHRPTSNTMFGVASSTTCWPLVRMADTDLNIIQRKPIIS